MQHGWLVQVAQGHQVISTREAIGVAERWQLGLDGVGQHLWDRDGAGQELSGVSQPCKGRMGLQEGCCLQATRGLLVIECLKLKGAHETH